MESPLFPTYGRHSVTSDRCVLPVTLQHSLNVYLHHALPLCVILTRSSLRPWYMEHYLQVCSRIQLGRDGSENLWVDFVERETAYRDVMIEIPLGPEWMRTEGDIIDFLKNRLRLGYYGIVKIDESVLPQKMQRPGARGVHESLIYGFDDEHELLMAIGFDSRWTFNAMTFDYADYRAAFQRGLEMFSVEADGAVEGGEYADQGLVRLVRIRRLHGDYPFSLRRFLRGVESYIYGVGDTADNYFGHAWGVELESWDERAMNEDMRFGSAVYTQLIEHLQRLMSGEHTMDYRHVHLMYEHSRGLLERVRYALGGFYPDSRVEELLDRYRILVTRLDQARLLFIKHGVSGDAELLQLVCGHLAWAQKEEVCVLASLCGRLQDWQIPQFEPDRSRALE